MVRYVRKNSFTRNSNTIQGYNIFHKDRVGRKGGGVVLYARDTLQCFINKSVKTNNNTESIWIDIKEGRENFLVGLIYRPPNSTNDNTSLLVQEINRACKQRQICILGDFNFRNINWENITGDREAEEFLNTIQNNFLKQMITEPTRGNNILDLILTKNENNICGVDVGGKLGNSDHEEIRFAIKWDSNITICKNKTRIPNFRKTNWDNLRSRLRDKIRMSRVRVSNSGRPREVSEIKSLSNSGEGSASTDSELRVLDYKEVELKYNTLVNNIIASQEEIIPYRAIRDNGSEPHWFTKEIKHLIGAKGVYTSDNKMDKFI